MSYTTDRTASEYTHASLARPILDQPQFVRPDRNVYVSPRLGLRFLIPGLISALNIRLAKAANGSGQYFSLGELALAHPRGQGLATAMAALPESLY
jgi:hypothetical protein